MADMNLSHLMESAAGHQKKLREDTKSLISKWEKTGLLEGLDSDYERSGMAILLENQAKQLIDEASKTGTASNSEEWSGVALPLVRRVFAEIAAKEMVSVQPMNLPSGLVFYLDFKYGTAQPGFKTGYANKNQSDSTFGITDSEWGTAPSEGLYGAGRFGYSINEATTSLLTDGVAQAVVAATFGTSSVTAESDFNFDAEFSASYGSQATYQLKKVLISSASMTRADTKGVRAFEISGSGIRAYFPQFTTYNSTTGNTTFLIQTIGTAAASPINAVVKYQAQPTDTTRGDFEDGSTSQQRSGTDLDIPEINVTMNSVPIVAKTRKLKAVWTPEFAQDLNAYHSIDAEAELTSMLSEYISQEIDLEILDMLIGSAQTTERWSARIGYGYNPATTAFENQAGSGQAYNQGTWFQTLGTKIQKVSNKIHQLTMRGGANFLVCSPTVATIIESIPGYAADTDGNQMNFAMGVQKIGGLNNRWTVYKNPYMTENTILMGYRGTQFLETGAVYAPYVPLIMTPLIYDPTNFTPRKGVMTRYAKKMVRPEFYGKIFVADLNRF